MTQSAARYPYAACRTVGHHWDQIPTTRRPPWGILVTYRCTACHTIREDCLDIYYALSTRNYIYPDNYQTEKRTRDEWRAASVTRAFAKRPTR